MLYPKIISLVPSITLLLFDLGLENSIIGRTKFCIHPKEKVKQIPTIGGTKNIDIEKIKTLQPTIIFATKEENEKVQIIELKKIFNVVIFDVKNLGGFINRPVKVFLDSLSYQKGMPQRIYAFNRPIEWWSEKMSYSVDYVYPDSTYVITIIGKKTFLKWKKNDSKFNWLDAEVMAEIPLYKFQQDSTFNIEITKLKTSKEKYTVALRNNSPYVEKSLYQFWFDKVGEDSIKKMIEKGMLPNKLP